MVKSLMPLGGVANKHKPLGSVPSTTKKIPKNKKSYYLQVFMKNYKNI
jgi:hypothetical protein